MSNVISMPKGEVAVIDPTIIESIVTKGDLSGLNQVQKVQYYNYRCKQIGLDPSAKPFDLLNLSGKQVLYANAGATQQLCNLHKLSTQITNKERVDDIYVVSVRVTGADGRSSENQGAVSIGNLKGDALANDETEVETIPNAHKESIVIPQAEPIPTMPVVMDKPAGDWPLFVPGNDEPYSFHPDADGWVDAFLTLIDKVAQSKKISIEDKSFKIGEFETVNRKFFAQVRDANAGLYEVLSNGIGTAKHSINKQIRERS